MRKFFFHNSLSIVFFLFFLVSITAQFFTGYTHHNTERAEEGQPVLSYRQYMHSGHFLQSTFENWESEFLQMPLFVLFTIWLRQKGSSESKSCDGPEAVDRNPDPSRSEAPWAVKRGGMILTLYKNSLTIALLILFLLSFMLHFYGSLKDENEQLPLKGMPTTSMGQYLLDPRFWFESLQNWQSEFLSVFILVVFLFSSGSRDLHNPNL